MDPKDFQMQLNKFISRLEELEIENRYLKELQHTHHCQLVQNVKLIESKHSKLYRKYLKCIYDYGIYKSCLTALISQYNQLLDRHDREMPKLTLSYCIEKFGIVYEGNRIIDEQQMSKIIAKRIKKESEDINALFFPTKHNKAENLSDSDQSVTTYTFQSQQSHRLRAPKDEPMENVGDCSEDQLFQNLTTQRYLEKIQTDHNYQQFLNEETISYPKTIKVDKLLQLNQLGREANSQLITDRQKKVGNKMEGQVPLGSISNLNQSSYLNPSPQKLNQSLLNEDRLKRFDQNESGADTRQSSRRRSRAERLMQK